MALKAAGAPAETLSIESNPIQSKMSLQSISLSKIRFKYKFEVQPNNIKKAFAFVPKEYASCLDERVVKISFKR